KMMNEGCATYVHYEIMRRLLDTGQITEGAYMEFLHSHTNVVAQPDFDDRRYYGLNPYALGFAMMKDIERICVNPELEDRHWVPPNSGQQRHNGDAEGYLGQLSRRKLCFSVPEPACHPQTRPISRRRRPPGKRAVRRCHPQRAWLHESAPGAGAAL